LIGLLGVVVEDLGECLTFAIFALDVVEAAFYFPSCRVA